MTTEDFQTIRELLLEAGSPKEVLTTDEAAAYLGITKSALYKLTMGRKIPFYKSAKLCYFDRGELIAWMKANRVATQEELDAKAREILKKKGGKK
ncbi:MAG: helix-turn-helix domain-containing protein [Bacteroidaceae bacterium]